METTTTTPVEKELELPPELAITLVQGIDDEPQVELIPKPNDDLMVFARTPGELEQSQGALIEWATHTVALHKRKLKEAEDNLKAAADAKVKTAPWKRIVSLAKRKIVYYEKIKEALDAGYFIVPDFPINVIAVRTKKLRPTQSEELVEYRHNIHNEKPQELPVGVGEYVNPTKFSHNEQIDIVRDRGGEKKPVKETWYRIWGQFAEIDFPLRVVRPQVLESFGAAAKKKLFDSIGVMPDNRKDRDPMIIGTIEMREASHTRRVSFLIAWWIPVSSL